MIEQATDIHNLGMMAGQASTQKDAYTWLVIYDDGYAFDEQLATQGFASVEHERVRSLLLIGDDSVNTHRVSLPQGATPIFFRRRSIEINLLQETNSPRPTVHCIGWKRGDEATYLFVFLDGSTLLTDDLQAV